MQSGREVRKAVFLDTQQYYTENEILRNSIQNSKKKTVLFEAEEYPDFPDTHKQGQVQVTK